jgi:hypothetical protein
MVSERTEDVVRRAKELYEENSAYELGQRESR